MRALEIIVVSIILLACSGDADTALTPTPSPEPPPPITVRGPIDWQTAFAPGAWDYFSRYVLEVASGQIYAIDVDTTTPPRRPTYIGWLGDGALVASFGDTHYRVHLGGEVARTDAPSGAAPTPFDAVHSADGLWSVAPTGDGLRLTEDATGRTLDVPYTGPYEWAPVGHRLVVGGGWCGNGRIAVVDPGGAGVIPVTTGRAESRGVVWTWRPDGAALALDAWIPGRSFILVDAITGAISLLLPIPPPEAPGELVPLQWNPLGTHLLFRIQGGRDCSD
jgi:hypothetical protein